MAWYNNPEEAYKVAQRRIQQALEDKSIALDLHRLGLTTVPPEIVQLTNLQ